jgi:hypothetical protein
LLYLLENMFDLDDRHYAAIFLHPRYYSAMGEFINDNKTNLHVFILFYFLTFMFRILDERRKTKHQQIHQKTTTNDRR